MRVLTSTPVAAVSILALALALFGAADSAAAQPTEEQVAAIKASCRSHYMSYCRSVPRGGAEAMQCLKKNIASLSASCQQAVKAATTTAVAPPSAPAPEAKPAAEAKPATTPTEPTPTSPPAATAKAVAPSPASSSGSASPTQEGSAEAAASAASSAKTAPSSTPKAQPIPKTAAAPAAAAVSSQGDNTAKTSAPASSGTAAAGSTGTAPAGASVEQPGETETAAPAEPATTTAAVPTASSPHGFIPPRKKLMVLRNCRQDLNTYCADAPYGDGRQLSCLESNLAKLTPDCQGALARLAR